jgi:transitional endoplasmic reticulum ATPase
MSTILTVAEAGQTDVGKSIARIPEGIMKKLGVNADDAIEIRGKARAVAIVKKASTADGENEIIRIDGTLRFNADTSLGDKVEVKKVECSEAESVTVSPMMQVTFSEDPSKYFHMRLLGKPVIKNQRLVFDVMGTHLNYIVSKVSPGPCVIITDKTKVIVATEIVKSDNLMIPEVSYEDIGGMKKEIEMIREMVEVPMKHPEVFQRLGIGAPKGVILTGPPGTGKTLLAKAVASETDSHFYTIAGPEIMSNFQGESEKKLREMFEEAGKNAPSILFIDEIDSIAPKRGEGHDPTTKRVVAQLLTSMDGIRSRGNVVVMAATNRPDDIDEALRRPGRFDREIRIMPPDEAGRLEILQIHSRGMPLSDDVDLKEISAKTIGFTGADLEMVCKEAAMKALKKWIPDLKKYPDQVPTYVLENIIVNMENFSEALRMVEPSAMRELIINRPKTRWTDIGGLDDAKKVLIESIELPMKNPTLFSKAGIKPPKGVLLYGPSGTGKTLLAKAVANESDANFIAIKGPELVSKWVGESEKKIREVFSKARQLAPAVIFFDEFDSISKVRGASLSDSTERMVNQLLTELDGIEELENVTVIAATNRPDLIDPALLRPGRIDMKVEVPLPDEKARRQIFDVHTANMPIAKEVNTDDFIKRTDNWSGADIEGLCREAGLNAIRESLKSDVISISKNHFENAFKTIEKRQKAVGFGMPEKDNKMFM